MRLDKVLQKCKNGLWKKEDAPAVTAWVEHSAKGLALVEEACDRPRCYLPWVLRKPDGSWIDALPSYWGRHGYRARCWGRGRCCGRGTGMWRGR